ncbi:MAG TPA: spore germination protein GerPB [Bacilli bacterium]
MNITVNQNILIKQLQIQSISQSSVLQIGTAGKISGLSRAFNFAGYVPGIFAEPGVTTELVAPSAQTELEPAVPLPSITA